MYKIKNWSTFQPKMRKDRNVIWIKVYTKILDDYDYQILSSDAKATLIELWLLASENNGTIKSLDEICFKLRKEKPFIARQLKDLSNFVQEVGKSSATSRQNNVRLEVEVEKEVEIEKSKPLSDSRTKVILKIENDFDIFWKAYPNKSGKVKAKKFWLRDKPNLETILQALEWQITSDKWLAENGKFVPMGSTYVNEQRYTDGKVLTRVERLSQGSSSSGFIYDTKEKLI